MYKITIGSQSANRIPESHLLYTHMGFLCCQHYSLFNYRLYDFMMEVWNTVISSCATREDFVPFCSSLMNPTAIKLMHTDTILSSLQTSFARLGFVICQWITIVAVCM